MVFYQCVRLNVLCVFNQPLSVFFRLYLSITSYILYGKHGVILFTQTLKKYQAIQLLIENIFEVNVRPVQAPLQALRQKRRLLRHEKACQRLSTSPHPVSKLFRCFITIFAVHRGLKQFLLQSFYKENLSQYYKLDVVVVENYILCGSPC